MSISSMFLLHKLQLDLANQSALEPDWRKFAILALEKKIFSKYLEDEEADASLVAECKFLSADIKCSEWELCPESLTDEYLIGEFRNELYRFWYKSATDGLVDDFYQLYQLGSVGPGKALGANGDSLYAKLFASKLTSTSSTLYIAYRTAAFMLPSTLHAEMARIADHGDVAVVPGNSLTFVPKSREVSRTIAIEPSLNMFFQMGLAHVLLARLEQVYNIDLANQQEKQRELAYRGSVGEGITTLDLSSASDTISMKMLKSMIPAEMFEWLALLRSPNVTLPDGTVRKLNMVSSMGNAFTFPLETIIFRAVISAAARLHPGGERWGRASQEIGVYGDDMAFPTVLYGKVTRLLKLLGFSVNAEKTFYEGPFRESCGHDYFDGHDVRPIYLKRLSTVQERCVAVNSLIAWSARIGVNLPNLVGALLPFNWKKFLVPPDEGFDAGILAPDFSQMRRGIFLYYAFRAISVFYTVKGTRVVAPEGVRKLTQNPAGVYCSWLNGNIRDDRIPVRQRQVRYKRKRCVSPNWGYIPVRSALGQELLTRGIPDVKQRWNSAARVVLLNGSF
jgi:hypothetical protein